MRNRLRDLVRIRSCAAASAIGLLLASCIVPFDALAATACGGNGQRGCCVASTERDNLGGACASGAVELPGCGSATGQSDCKCGGSGLAVFFGSSSSSHCVVPTSCGGEGQRACCTTESRYPNNPIPLSAGCSGTAGGGVNNLTEVAGGVPQPAVCGGSNPFGLLSNGHCVRCGTEGAHACEGAGVGAGQRCQPGLVEDAFGFCASCGGEGQLICRSTAKEDWMCNRGFHPDGGVCRKDQVIAEPDCDCQPVAPSGNPAAPVRGYADLHLHMFANLGFGGLVVWGDAFDRNGGISQALRADNYAQRTADYIINGHVKQGINGDVVPIDLFRRQQLVHGDNHVNDIVGFGTEQLPFPTLLPAPILPNDGVEWEGTAEEHFAGWPRWNSTTHQQAYYTWLLRAHRGGLQLAVMLAVTNESMCIAGRYLDYPQFDCANSKASIDLQLAKAFELEEWLGTQCAVAQQQLQATNNPIFAATLHETIARTCAHSASNEGWFKVVRSPQEARQAIAKGQLAVVLGIEEATLFGCNEGSCTTSYVQEQLDEYFDKGVRHVFPIHNFDNDFGGAASWMDTIAVGNRYATGKWFATEECPAPPGEAGGGAGYGFKLAPGFSDWLAGAILGVGYPFLDTPSYYPGLATSCNQQGLTPLGRTLVTAMMSRGMIIDIDHMSIKAVDATLALALEHDYPGVVASHALMFDLTKKAYRHERMRTADQLRRIAALGGMVGAMTQPPEGGDPARGEGTPVTILPPPGTKVTNDCQASSMTWAQMYEWAVNVMTVDGVKRPVAFGTDFNGISRHNAPRFGPEACDHQAPASPASTRMPYPFTVPGFGTFQKQETGGRVFDYNESGLAHVGLLPDMVQDLKTLGLTDQDLDPLFQSAEAYIRMWEKSLEAAVDIDAPNANDTTAPMATVALSSPANAYGWHNDPLLVATITATDEPGGSGVSNIIYRLTSEQAFHNEPGEAFDLFLGAEGTSTVLYSARDVAGNSGPLVAVGVRQDLTAPASPADLAVVAASASRIDLTWAAATDGGGSGLDGYALERCRGSGCTNFTEIARPATNGYSDSGLDAATGYRYRLRAVDRAGNRSGHSNAVGTCTDRGDGANPNYGGMWWNAPAASESGWGLNIAHQCDVLFVTWFTYRPDGKPTWLVVAATKIGANVYSGTLYTGAGPAFNSASFDPALVVPSEVGTATLTFSDDSNGTFHFNVVGISRTKQINRQLFGSPVPTCTWGAQQPPAGATNFQDMWWKSPAGSESGWGVNFAHQGDTIVATWFTYGLDGKATWFILAAARTGANVYSGDLYTGTGPAFSAVPFDPDKVAPQQVGTATLTFADGNNATFAFTIDGVTRSKTVTRQVFGPPGTVCQ